MRRALLLLTAFGGLVAAPAVAAAVAEEPVLASTRNEFGPTAGTHAGGDGLLAFARSRPGKRHVYDAYLRRTSPGGTTLVKLNTQGRGFAGGIDSPRLVYQQVVRGRSNLKLYDIDTGVRSNPPAGVNTSRWEYRPTLSGDWLLYGSDGVDQSVRLFNLATSEQRILVSTARLDEYLFAGHVAGNWAVWTRCRRVCTVFRHDIAAGTTAALPKPAGKRNRSQYAASLTAAGIVYAGRSGLGCGTRAKIVRFFGASDPATGAVLARLPRGRDFFYTSPRENADGSVDVFYDRFNCKQKRWDVYRVTDPDPSAPPPRGTSSRVDSESSETRSLDSASGKKLPFSQLGKRSR